MAIITRRIILLITTFHLLICSTQACLLGSFFDWDIYITNKIPTRDPVMAHVKSGDTDFGNRTIPYNTNFHFKFCLRVDLRTLYYGYFWWGNKYQTFDVFNKDLMKRFEMPFGNNFYWEVRPDGFYLSKNNGTENYWHWMHSWTP